MKVKSFATFISGLLVAVSFVYTIPAMADDAMNGDQQMLADSGMNSSDNGGMGSDMQNNNALQSSDNSGDAGAGTSSGGNGDGGSQDTATGDDDY